MEDHKEIAQRCFNAYMKFVNKKFGINISSTLDYSITNSKRANKKKTAGLACRKVIGHDGVGHVYEYRISLHEEFLKHNLKSFLNDTIPHEIAHLVAYEKYARYDIKIAGHGPEWQDIMRIMGIKPEKYHKMTLG